MASKRRKRRKACGDKVRHDSREEALLAMRKIYRNFGYNGPLNVYRCPFGTHWHVGHKPRPKPSRHH